MSSTKKWIERSIATLGILFVLAVLAGVIGQAIGSSDFNAREIFVMVGVFIVFAFRSNTRLIVSDRWPANAFLAIVLIISIVPLHRSDTGAPSTWAQWHIFVEFYAGIVSLYVWIPLRFIDLLRHGRIRSPFIEDAQLSAKARFAASRLDATTNDSRSEPYSNFRRLPPRYD